jgi:Ser/Thr protein kinase RdoA (MazF antagonist)
VRPAAAAEIPAARLLDFLRRHGLVSDREVVEQGVRLLARPRERFEIWEVQVRERRRWLLKAAREEGARHQIAREGAALAYLASRRALRGCAPALGASDPLRGILAVEFVGDATPGGGGASTARDLPLSLLRPLAALLAALHRETCHAPPPLASEPPPILGLLSGGLGSYAVAWSRVWQLAARRERIGATLAEARDTWRGRCLVHGDVKSEHCIVTGQTAAGSSLKLVDWEIARIGDPAWDVAGAIQEIVLADAFAVPPDPRRAELPARARTFFHAYREAAAAAGAGLDLCERVALYVAARLFQSSLEAVVGGAGRSAAARLVSLTERFAEDRAAVAGALARAA